MSIFENRRVWIAGHTGMVGSALRRRLERESCTFLTVSHGELDLRCQADVEAWMAANRPDLVFVAAATVGGIRANDTRPAEFLYDNLMIESNIIHAAREIGVSKLLFLGSSCIYPRLAEQPMTEEALLSGPLEPTNQWYALAKIAGIKLCQAYRRQHGCDFISAMPTNLYGMNDNFSLESSHVLPALIAKMHAAKVENRNEVVVWGTGRPRREFLYADECADALVFLMQHYEGDGHINVGTGEDLSIAKLAELIARIVGYDGGLKFDPSIPDGAPRKLLDVGKLTRMGWKSRTSLEDGIRETYGWYLRQLENGAIRQ